MSAAARDIAAPSAGGERRAGQIARLSDGRRAPYQCVENYNECIACGLDRGECAEEWCGICRENPRQITDADREAFYAAAAADAALADADAEVES